MRLREIPAPGFERVVAAEDADHGLHAVIALHDTTRGPATGGCRMFPYASEAAALTDVLRLAEGMSYKSALAELPLGGGKAVLLADPARDKTPELLRAFGRAVEALGGSYVAAEDVGISVEDVEVIASVTRHVAGRSAGGGDPSPHTALGVHVGIAACLAELRGVDAVPDLAGVRVAVQGLGQVGLELVRLLLASGAEVLASDVEPARAERASALGARTVAPGRILEEPCAVLAPCALGAVLNADTIPRLRASIVAGAANNQLATPEDGDRVAARGILYAPDYAINAGGIINIAAELRGPYDPAWAEERVRAIGPRLRAIFAEARARGVAPERAADAMARRILAGSRQRDGTQGA